MKKLLFIGIVALMVQSLGAVTLPSTSYSPYSASSPSDGSFITAGGTMVTGSYSSLGSGGYDDPNICKGESPDTPPAGKGSSCEECCKTYSYDPCKEAKLSIAECAQYNYACTNSCQEGPSLPLDGGLSILLILSLAGGAIKLIRVKGL